MNFQKLFYNFIRETLDYWYCERIGIGIYGLNRIWFQMTKMFFNKFKRKGKASL